MNRRATQAANEHLGTVVERLKVGEERTQPLRRLTNHHRHTRVTE